METGIFPRAAYHLLGKPEGGFRNVADIAPEEFVSLGATYAEAMETRFGARDRYTDKTIQTYTFMGAVKLAIPRARVVVVRRDPRDTLFSIYRNVFAQGAHLYAYDLRDLGLYHRLYEDMLDFWRENLPGYFYEVHYERLIADPEGEIRKLLTACELDWQDACLNFQSNARRVETLSLFQVRQPIYTSSLRGWKRYEKELRPMLDALESGL